MGRGLFLSPPLRGPAMRLKQPRAQTIAGIAILVLLATSLTPSGEAATNWIQPGDQHDGSCTLNFVYDGTGPNNGKVFIGTAAHCVGRVGQHVSTTGYSRFGTVAWVGDEDRTAWDFAFIEVKPAFEQYVNPAVKGHPGYPVGYTVPADTNFGDAIQVSGFGLGYGWTTYTQENRQAAFQFDDGSVYAASGPLHWGDSGGPLVHKATGKALGIVSSFCTEEYFGCTDEGPTVQGILTKAANSGFPVTLRTV